MYVQPTYVLVFKTNLQTQERIDAVRLLLDQHPKVVQWNVDRHDPDNVLRIVPQPSLKAAEISTLVREAGFVCEELPD